MCIYVCVCVCVCVSVCLYVCVLCVYVCMYVNVCMYVCMCMCVDIVMCVHMRVCVRQRERKKENAEDFLLMAVGVRRWRTTLFHLFYCNVAERNLKIHLRCKLFSFSLL
jgi:hypothetical protein